MKVKTLFSVYLILRTALIGSYRFSGNFFDVFTAVCGSKRKFLIRVFISFFLLLYPFMLLSAHSGDIKTTSKQLFEVKKSIREKELEKNKLISQERIFKKELKSLTESIKQNEKKLAKCSSDIKAVQNNIDNSSKIYNAAFSKTVSLNKAILSEVELFNKMTFMFSYEQNPVEYKIRRRSIEYKKNDFEKEKKTAVVSAANLKKWKESKKKVLGLQLREKKLVVQNENMLKERNELLKTTLDKRAAAEREIKALNDSAKALQALINKMGAASKSKGADVAGQHTPAIKRKKSFLWPVKGEIVSSFGKNKHPELDTYVMSNGVKIKAADFSQVKSAESGVVVFVGQFRSYGKVVIIDHKDSVFGVYGLLNNIFVKEKQKVSKGKVIAELGSGDNSVLCFEVRYNSVPDNPILWFQD